jgi:uncharacterized protein YehS (DUF1456 family)
VLSLPKTRGHTLINNDILRRIRYAFDLKDGAMIEIFTLAGFNATETQVSSWLKKEDDSNFLQINDTELAAFLNGFIIFKRGKRDDKPLKSEESLNNNIIFQKLRIALNLQAEEIINIFQMVNFRLSNHELSAFFRKPGHKNYRECKDQILRNFLMGIQLQLRPNHIDSIPDLES